MIERLEHFWHGRLNRPHRLHVEKVGNPHHPPIIFLHGIAASTEDWHAFRDVFEKEYYCIFIDLLGFGESPKPTWATYDMQTHTRSLFHTMNKLGLGRQFTLVGHSLGSFLAARYALEHGSSLKRLYLLSPPVYPSLSNLPKPYARKLTGALLALYRILRNERMTPATFRKLSKVIPLPRTIIEDPATWTPFMRTLQNCIEQQTILYDVKHSRVPTEVFYGSLDQVVINSNVELLAKNPLVSLHTFLGTHELSKKYAAKVKTIIDSVQI